MCPCRHMKCAHSVSFSYNTSLSITYFSTRTYATHLGTADIIGIKLDILELESLNGQEISPIHRNVPEVSYDTRNGPETSLDLCNGQRVLTGPHTIPEVLPRAEFKITEKK